MTTIEIISFALFSIALGYMLGTIAAMTRKCRKSDGRLIVDQTNPEEDFMRLELDVDTVGDILKKDHLVLKIVNKN